jgi:lipopolysaccharide transport system ATP-binding protein
MTHSAISVENLGKRYRIQHGTAGYRTLRETLVEAAQAPIRMLRTSSVSARQQDFWALREVNLEVRAGEVIGLIGRNGAGKSTLLKILSRITKPTTGRATLNGRVGSLLEVGTGFHPELTGRENIYLNGAILGMSKHEISRKFDEIVDFAEVSQFLETPVKRYSSGMYVRLAFAVAAHLEPEILLVDEVLAVGDAAFQRKCLGKMGQVARQGRTVVVVSHNMAMVQNLCGRTVLIDQGTVKAVGPTRQVVEIYLREVGALAQTRLNDRTDRTGAAEVICTAIEILDGNGQPAPSSMSGSPLIARIHYESKLPRVFRNSRISLSVHKYDQVYFLMSTELVDSTELTLRRRGYMDFIVPELPLSVGEYSLHSFIESNGVVQDWVIGAAQLSVVDGDFYGTGRNYPAGWEGRGVLVRHSWRHVDGQPELQSILEA